MFPVPEQPTISDLLKLVAWKRGSKTYLRYKDCSLSFSELARSVDNLAGFLYTQGINEGTKVAVMLPNSLNAVFTFFSLIRLGALQIPVNINLRAEPLDYLFLHSKPDFVIADNKYRVALEKIQASPDPRHTFWCDENERIGSGIENITDSPAIEPDPDRIVSIMYTSGTTGPPKGVMVTDKMHRACAYSSAMVADIQAGDCLYLWEPIYHITGTEVLILALMYNVSIGMTARFSASQFWSDVKKYKATHIHYVGGILQILLRQPTTDAEFNNTVRVAWGGGAPTGLWEAVADRFQLTIRENYGMTETSSLTTFNTDGKLGSVGRSAPYFEVSIFDETGNSLPTGHSGEIWVKDRGARLITPGYFENSTETSRAFVGDWFRTGDMGYLDEDNYLYYTGRLKDSVRRRGENISAWEIERVISQLDYVEECALIGVTDELEDEELKLCIKIVACHKPDPAAVFKYCDEKLPKFQVPRYINFVNEFEKTDTQRIKKERLSRRIDDSFTRDPDGRLICPD